QVAAHQKRVQLFPTLPVIALAAPDHGEPGALIESKRRPVVLLDLEEDSTRASACEMAKMNEEQIARQTLAAMAGIDRDREDLGFVSADSRYCETDDLSPKPEAMHQGVAFGEHALEFAFAPAAVKRSSVQLRQSLCVTDGSGFDYRRAATKQRGQPGHH